MNIEKELQEMEAKIAEIRLELAKPPAPEIDWERVIREKYLVEMKDHDTERWYGPGLLISYDSEAPTAKYKAKSGDWWHQCRLYTGPNVFIPHFGGPCPVDAKTKVLMRLRDGRVYRWGADILPWSHNGGDSDIMDYMVVGN